MLEGLHQPTSQAGTAASRTIKEQTQGRNRKGINIIYFMQLNKISQKERCPDKFPRTSAEMSCQPLAPAPPWWIYFSLNP